MSAIIQSFSRFLRFPYGKRAQVLHDQDGNPLSLSVDPFGRLRVGALETIFDSKQIDLATPAMIFASKTTGTGTIEYVAAHSACHMTVSAAGDEVIRQTRRYFNYQPGKGQLVKVTQASPLATGVVREAGYYDGRNGFCLRYGADGIVYIVRFSDTTGAVVETAVPQSEWNWDRFDGSGRSRVVLDQSAANIFFVAMAWLGVGDVAVGFQVGNRLVVAHIFEHANIVDGVYMRTPDLPIRWRIAAESAPASPTTMDAICCTIGSEGGQQALGVPRSDYSTISCTANLYTEVQSGRLRSTAGGVVLTHATVYPYSFTIRNTGNVEGEVLVTYRPYDQCAWDDVAAATPFRSPIGLDGVSRAQITDGGRYLANVAPTTLGSKLGHVLACFPLESKGRADIDVGKLVGLGCDVDDNADEMSIIVRPVSNATITCFVSWNELV